ncbi:hypothetical protein DPEC_G00364670 [Dallia pectoralis]|nr:hypothetical protein DPEC_G00364670 [Dallia pectoralis]
MMVVGVPATKAAAHSQQLNSPKGRCRCPEPGQAFACGNSDNTQAGVSLILGGYNSWTLSEQILVSQGSCCANEKHSVPSEQPAQAHMSARAPPVHPRHTLQSQSKGLACTSASSVKRFGMQHHGDLRDAWLAGTVDSGVAEPAATQSHLLQASSGVP